MNGKLYLVPVTLGGEDHSIVIPAKVIEIIKNIRYFVVEDLRSARRFLRLIDKGFPIDETVFFELNEHTAENEISAFLDPAASGNDTGLMSEAGLPCIADPGSRLVAMAHQRKIVVKPLTGPSSILLALIASGLNGQNFSFNGYLPAKAAELPARIKDLEKKASHGYAQIFMETPYRAQKLFEAVLSACRADTRLCIAENLTHEDELIRTMRISEWKKSPPSLNGRLVVFVLQ
jgi:16S rRNA (cytidine1402-2'-O)-methyltransferase